MPNKNELFSKLDSMGEDTVKQKLVVNAFPKDEIKLVREWLSLKVRRDYLAQRQNVQSPKQTTSFFVHNRDRILVGLLVGLLLFILKIVYDLYVPDYRDNKSTQLQQSQSINNPTNQKQPPTNLKNMISIVTPTTKKK